jgi:TP901 family phage tail tape measure protein
LGAIGVSLRSASGQFRDFNDVLLEIYNRYGSLTTVEKSALATTLAGVRQRENVLVLFENFGKAMEYTETAANSSGIAMEKFGAYEEGLEAKSNRLTAAFENMANSIIPSGLIGFFLDFGAASANLGAMLGGLPARFVAIIASFAAFKAASGMIGHSPFAGIVKDLGKPEHDRLWNIVPSHSKEAA